VLLIQLVQGWGCLPSDCLFLLGPLPNSFSIPETLLCLLATVPHCYCGFILILIYLLLLWWDWGREQKVNVGLLKQKLFSKLWMCVSWDPAVPFLGIEPVTIDVFQTWPPALLQCDLAS
jgi:hypothetical protein